MKVRRLVLALVACFLLAQNAIGGGPPYGSGRLVEWVPSLNPDLSLSAGYGKNGLPIVMYNPDFAQNVSKEYALFLLLRQDFVAYMAADRLRGDGYFSKSLDSQSRKGGSKSQGLPFTTIPESDIYSHPILRGLSSQGLDCLAYRALDRRDREKFLDSVRKATTTQQKLQVLPSTHIFSSQDLQFLETPECEDLFEHTEH
jgi:hypothetical protein